MFTISETKRLVKRVILTNLFSNNLYLTPLLSGKHGIGKSAIIKQIVDELNGVIYVIEGGTLKEGEITGLPYQYKDKENIEFKFLPYYVIKEIQEVEKTYKEYEYASINERIDLIRNKKIKPYIIFIDELNRTDNTVYRELMNIILTKTVNGYKLPWWCFFVGAINPSTMDSMYATNEMDPAQLDRFIKINVKENINDFLTYAMSNNFDESIINFLTEDYIYLSDNDSSLDDNEFSKPSPRGWEMINLIIKNKDNISSFFSKEELKYEMEDIKSLMISKVGVIATKAYESSLTNAHKLVTAKDIYDYKIDGLSKEVISLLKNQSTAMNFVTNKNVLEYLIKNYDIDNKKYHEKIINKTKIYMDTIDKSSKLVFAQYLANTNTINDVSLYDEFFELFNNNLIELIYSNMRNEDVLVNE